VCSWSRRCFPLSKLEQPGSARHKCGARRVGVNSTSYAPMGGRVYPPPTPSLAARAGQLLALRSDSERRRQPRDAPRRLQDDSKTAPGRSKMLQDAPSIPKRAQDVPRYFRDAPRYSQNTLKTSSRRLQDAMLMDLGA